MARNQLRSADGKPKAKRAGAPTANTQRASLPSPQQIDVGARLKALRAERNVSQRELATISGVTNGMISMVEQNKHSPSIATMTRITDALGISFSEFFSSGDDNLEPRIFFRPHDLSRMVDGKVEISIVAGKRRKKAMQILHEVYHPGGDTGPDMLSHPGEEGGVIISGEIEVVVGNKREILRAGDAYYFESHQPHRFRNIGTEDVVLISACTPPL